MFYLVKKYMIFEFEVVCMNFLIEYFLFENVFDILFYVKKFEDNEFVFCCWEVVDVRVEDVMRLEIFLFVIKELL